MEPVEWHDLLVAPHCVLTIACIVLLPEENVRPVVSQLETRAVEGRVACLSSQALISITTNSTIDPTINLIFINMDKQMQHYSTIIFCTAD